MIDTSKYKGHTPAPWNGKAKSPRIHSIMASGDGKMLGICYGTVKVEREDPNEDPYESIRATKPNGEWTDWAKADASLIADAPELLAEVKRLRLLAENLYDFYMGTYDGSLYFFEKQMDWRDEEEVCVECGVSVGWGGGCFVNRIPCDDGWICMRCGEESE